MNPTLDDGTTLLTFLPGTFQVQRVPRENRQLRLVSSSGAVRVIDLFGVDEQHIQIEIVALPTVDAGGFSGRNSLRTFLATAINWSERTCFLVDADGEVFELRYWGDTLDLREADPQTKKDQWYGTLTFRVEMPSETAYLMLDATSGHWMLTLNLLDADGVFTQSGGGRWQINNDVNAANPGRILRRSPNLHAQVVA